MSPALVERVLDVWERGIDHTLNERAALALALRGEDADVARQTVQQRDAGLLDLRRALFGDRFEGVVRCPACAVEFDLPIDLETIDPDTLKTAESEPSFAVTVEAGGCKGEVRAPRCEDLLALDRTPQIDYAAALFERCVVGAERAGRTIGAQDLPPAFRDAAATALAASCGEAPTTDLSCGECGHAWRAPIDVARALLDDLDDWARRLLDDIHRIARAYHWSEREIIALPLRRRLRYLDAIGEAIG